jgi:hypothetical protein
LWSISTFKSWWTLAFSSRWKMTYRLIWTSMFRSWCICTVCFIMMMHSMYVVYSIVVRRNIYIHGNEIVVYETSYVYQFMVYRKQTILHNSIYLPWQHSSSNKTK